MTPLIEVKKALVAGCGCIVREDEVWIEYCARHEAMLEEVKDILRAFKQDLEVKIVKERHERDMFS